MKMSPTPKSGPGLRHLARTWEHGKNLKAAEGDVPGNVRARKFLFPGFPGTETQVWIPETLYSLMPPSPSGASGVPWQGLACAGDHEGNQAQEIRGRCPLGRYTWVEIFMDFPLTSRNMMDFPSLC